MLLTESNSGAQNLAGAQKQALIEPYGYKTESNVA